MSNVRATWPYRKRRQYTPEFKAQLVAESQIPGASVECQKLSQKRKVLLNQNVTTLLCA